MTKFHRRNDVVDAIQHDGSNESALKLEAWILSEGGNATAYLKGAVDFAQKNAFVKISNVNHRQNLVGPGSWVVRVSEGIFYPVSNQDFNILYEPMVEPEKKQESTKYE